MSFGGVASFVEMAFVPLFVVLTSELQYLRLELYRTTVLDVNSRHPPIYMGVSTDIKNDRCVVKIGLYVRYLHAK